MRSLLINSHPLLSSSTINQSFIRKSNLHRPSSLFSNSPPNHSSSRFVIITSCSAKSSESIVVNGELHTSIGNPRITSFASPMPNLSLSDKAFFLISFIACTASVAFTGLVFAAVPTLFAMRNAAISLSKLADTAREELPSTMAAIRLSGMEISDLTLELSDLSQEIADGVSRSTQALKAAEAGIRQMGSVARQQTISMIQERASLPKISLQPVVAGAARKTSRAVGQATKSFMNLISRREDDDSSEEYDEGIMNMEDY